MKKTMKPGDMYNKMMSKKGKLRSADSVVKSEQNASHQFTKGKKSMKSVKKTTKKTMSKPMSKIKTSGTFKGKSNKLGGGGRFAQLKSKLSGKVSNPGAVAAVIGRKKYGAKKMAKMAAKGKSKKA